MSNVYPQGMIEALGSLVNNYAAVEKVIHNLLFKKVPSRCIVVTSSSTLN